MTEVGRAPPPIPLPRRGRGKQEGAPRGNDKSGARTPSHSSPPPGERIKERGDAPRKRSRRQRGDAPRGSRWRQRPRSPFPLPPRGKGNKNAHRPRLRAAHCRAVTSASRSGKQPKAWQFSGSPPSERLAVVWVSGFKGRNSLLWLGFRWRPRRDLNPCYRRERPVSWADLDDGDRRITTLKKTMPASLPGTGVTLATSMAAAQVRAWARAPGSLRGR